MADARLDHMVMVLAEALDRINRDQEHTAVIWKGLQFAGIRLVTLSEGEVNELHVGLRGTMNAMFLKDLAAKTHRGLAGRVEAGKTGGGLCYGYRVVRGFNERGEPSGATERSSPARLWSCAGSSRCSPAVQARSGSRSH